MDEFFNFFELIIESGGLDFNVFLVKVVDVVGGDYDWIVELSFFEEYMFVMYEVF